MDIATSNRRQHLKQRAEERYSWQLNRADRRTIEAKIRDGESINLGCQPKPDGTFSDNADRHAVKIYGRWIIVLYDFVKREMASVLPRYLIRFYGDKIFGTKKENK